MAAATAPTQARADALDDYKSLSEMCRRSGSTSDATCTQRDKLELKLRTQGYYQNGYDGYMSPERIDEFERIVRSNRVQARPTQLVPPPIKPAPMPEHPHTSALSERLLVHLESAPPGMREDFLFENRPATMWRLTCKQIAQFQSGMANTDKDRAFVAWQATAPGNLLTVLRVDGSTSQSCYEPTTRGIRIFGKGQQPFDSNLR
ncbi:hypothetical protein FFI97_001635 [Variovorax sp. KBS0712]|uniref:hypothetical protein n=1 Tax=Variovorax sp. KBS0712 TaxID=2578111 RepID=UPI00117C8EEA|nr:hypothetical protein [Variovorax sp. KBS0712]TSD59059.1 hypothetical protein FFI97_001635 [Variovorax sp. KBS0712]